MQFSLWPRGGRGDGPQFPKGPLLSLRAGVPAARKTDDNQTPGSTTTKTRRQCLSVHFHIAGQLARISHVATR